MKVVGYIRVSSKEQFEEGYSIPAQRELLENFCKDRGYKLLKVFQDVESGGKHDRKGFISMVEYVEAQKVEGVIAWRLDRLTRNFRDYVTLDDLPAKLIFIAEPDVSDSATGKLMLGIRISLAKHFLDQLGENVSMALERKAREGHWPSVAPIGYMNNEGLIETDPERAPLLRKLFEEYATGNHTIDSIRKLAKELGLRQPRSGKPLARSRFVSTSANVKGLLQNPIYYGVFEWKGERYVGKHEPIISKELFDDVQGVIEQRSRGTRKRQHDFPFAGLVHCTCGRMLTAEKQKGHLKRGEYTYYRCNDRKKCGGPFVREEKLAEMMGEAIKALEMDDEVYEVMRDALEESQTERKRFVQEQTLRLQGRYQTLQNAIDTAYEDRLRDVIDEQLFKRKSKAWREEMQEIEIELESLRKATESYHDEGLKLIELAQVAHGQYLAANPTKQAKMLKTVVSNLVFDGTSIAATYRKPFDVLAERPSDQEWLPECIGLRTTGQDPATQKSGSESSTIPSQARNPTPRLRFENKSSRLPWAPIGHSIAATWPPWRAGCPPTKSWAPFHSADERPTRPERPRRPGWSSSSARPSSGRPYSSPARPPARLRSPARKASPAPG